MKKITSILLAILLLIALVATSVFAAGEDASASVTSATGAPGEVVKVTLSLSDFANTKSVGVTVTPEEGLKLSKENCAWSMTGVISDIDLSTNMAVWAVNDATSINGEFMTLAFVVPEPAEGQTDYTYDFTLNVQAKNGGEVVGAAETVGTVTVVIPATELALDKSTLQLDLRDAKTGTVTATVEPANTTEKLTWSSSNTAVATVENGTITAVSRGEAVITAKIGTLSATCNVTVICSHNLVETPAKESTCKEQGNNQYWTCSVCHDVFKADQETLTTVEAETLPLGDHKYSETLTVGDTTHWYECTVCETAPKKDEAAHTYVNPQYVWSEDNTKCTAAAVCACGATVQEEVGTQCVTTPASCYEKGSHVYTAVFTKEWATVQSKTVDIEATQQHSFANPTYEWIGYTSCTATAKCTTDGCTATDSDTAVISQEVTEEPTCGETGVITYTAAFTKEWAAPDTKEDSVPATGEHNYIVSFAWDDEKTTCTASWTCNACTLTGTATVDAADPEESKAPTCVDKGENTHTATFTETWIPDDQRIQTTTSEIAPTGLHTYEVSGDFTWNEEKSSCSVTGECAVCEATIVATAEASFEVTLEPTCAKTGTKTHTAVFTEAWIDEQKTQTTISVIPATNQHSWVQDGEAQWVKSGDTYACTVYAKCTGDACTATNTAEATVTSVTTDPTCWQDGQIVYTAEFAETWAAAAPKTDVIERTGQHTFAPGEYQWTDYDACSVEGKCTTEGCTATETAEATITSETTEATCGKDGQTVYTATFNKNWAVTQTKTQIHTATGNHTWNQDGEAVWTESNGTYTCVANAKCGVCEGTTSATAEVTFEVTTENDCGNDGVRTYTAKFEEDWAAEVTKEVEIPATGNHTYVAVDGYTWNDALTICTVQGKCNVCEARIVAGATITSEITTQPTCKDTGVRTYTATFEETWATNQTKEVVEPATGNHIGGGDWFTDETNHWRICATDGCNEITDLAAHSFEWKIDKDSTEDETGLKHEECTCGMKRSENTEIPLKPHVHIEIKHFDAVAATCTATGNVEYWTCGSYKCEGIFYADAEFATTYEDIVLPIDPNNHGTTELRDAVAPNCYQSGYSGDAYCLGCGELAEEGKTLEATGEHVGDNVWVIDADSHWQTCTTEGCGAKVSKTAHIFQWKVDKAATEDETGLKHEECACGYKRNENTEIPKLDHVHIQIAHHEAVKATCVKEGVKEHWTCGSDKCQGLYYGDDKCQTLLDTIVVPVDTTNHGALETKDALAATCSEAGYTGDAYCTVCQTLVTKGAEIPATGEHTPADKLLSNEKQHWKVCSHCQAVVEATLADHGFVWIVDKQPTEAATGLKHEECSTCKYVRNENTVVDKLQHAPYLVSAKAATCTEDGRIEHFYCGSCGGYYASNNGKIGTQISYSDTVVAATGHSFDEKWLNDGEYHWHECACGETSEPEKHSFQTVGAEEATETTMGYTGDTVCSVCEYVSATGEKTNAMIVVEVKNEAGEVVHAAPIVDLVITNVSEVHSGEEVAISKEAAEALQIAYEELNAEDVQLSVLVPELVTAVEEKGLDAAVTDELVLIDLFDVTIINEELESYLNEEGHTIDLTFEADVAAGDHVFVMVYKNGVWQLIENVINNGDGTITCTFEHFCPVAILTVPGETADEEASAIVDAESAEGGFPWWIVVIVVVILVIGGVAMYAAKQRKARRRRSRSR